MALRTGDQPDLSEHERELLHHIPAEGGVALTWVAQHLAFPKSSTSVLVKDLERRGFVRRRRDPADERRLAIVLTEKGRRRVAADRVLDPRGLRAALSELPAPERESLLRGLERLAEAATRRPARPRSRGRGGRT